MGTVLDNPDLLNIEEELRDSSNRIVFFIGAGLSKVLGFPLWHELLHQLIAYGKSIDFLTASHVEDAKRLIREGDYLNCGELLRSEMGLRVEQFLNQLFRATPEDLGGYERLVRLPCAGYITTNYDECIEAAYAKCYGKNLRPILPFDTHELVTFSTKRPFLLKLHGDVARESYVVSASDYKEMQHNEALGRFLFSLFSNFRIVFLGYGMTDRDILTPLEKLAWDYKSTARRHVALLPQYSSSVIRRSVEKHTSINVVPYDSSQGHGVVDQVLLRWLASAYSGRLTSLSSQEYSAILQDFPRGIADDLRSSADRGLKWLFSMQSQWGPNPNKAPTAANTAEVIIAATTANRVLRARAQLNDAVMSLLAFERDGAFISKTLGTPNIQTHGLVIYALSFHQHRDDIVAALSRGRDWLLENRLRDGAWGRFVGMNETHTIPSVWAFMALARLDEFPLETWRKFRDEIVSKGVIDLVLGGAARSMAAAGWLLWLLSYLRSRDLWEDADTRLATLALSQLSYSEDVVGHETEYYQLDLPGTGEGVRFSWIHTTASAVALGCLGWVESYPSAWEHLGKAMHTLMLHSSRDVGGRFKDPSLEREGAEPFVFYTAYAVWAICECIQKVVGALIDKVGLLVVREKKVLLVRKKSGDDLIVPGGTVHPGEASEDTLHREIREELGIAVQGARFWATFEDAAAFEPGATVRIRAYTGELRGKPRPSSEIAELFWINSRSVERLSPIVKNKIVPALIEAGMID